MGSCLNENDECIFAILVGAGGAPFDYNTQPDAAKPFFLKKSEDQVKRAIPLRSIAAAYAGLSIKPNHGQHQI